MADITEPQVRAFVDERIRPICDALVGLDDAVDSMLLQWYAPGGTSATISGYDGTDTVPLIGPKDTRNQLTKDQLITTVANLQTIIQTAMDGVGVASIIAWASVNPRNPVL